MGLPLFMPPVESDVPSKAPTKGPTDLSQSRSPIRRNERRRQLNETREQRLRMLAALQASDYSSQRLPRPPRPNALHPSHPPHPLPSTLPSTLQRSSNTRSTSRPADTPRASGRQSPRLENPRISELNDAEQQYLGRTAASELRRGFAIDDLDDAWNQLTHAMPSHFPSASQRPVPLPSAPSRYTPFGHTTSDVPRRSIWRREDDRDNAESRYRRRRYAERDSIATHRHAQRVRYVDGLGDRDRSLSPEGDGVWDTLQSTLTPDPQPPSVGSSFASTVVSANTSEANGTNSVNTSMTTLNEEIEPPCDPVTDNPGSEDEDDRGEQPDLSNELWLQSTIRDWRRSYADVAAGAQSRQSPESGDASEPDREWLSGMHHIVRGLASRVDIPDEWWAQAGLSRSMSWEDSNQD
ncbi:hypothetical protein E0Z10_g4055 [Xylaria hypoxylon]|uniref:Uncharacterized protein n=1 Tax=Xylaria hypoxylon TaxID=37992 RepID=A0A4Z0YZQ6_9PEZI|nr:hypothetical protein E0Z10_g4055 [Xylaria hypoxylon]